ncbi:TetR family transcriptional regulator [Paenisporosarcina sp. OV554]|nr:TetR/AcrR family transcriptional regulator [Paenisporosarcina sp. OV554]PUB10440.1 TetR family transcriptional regulator [Paenisporosarcina sp. OV554]
MYSKFLNVDPEKQERIINAASKEFAQKGYDNASTNEIVKEAGISKGLLFHYFKNKKGLYLFIFDYLQEMFREKIYENINWNEKDLFIRYREIGLLKFELIKSYPETVNFIKVAYLEDSNEVKSDLEQRQNILIATAYQKLFSDFDHSKFKENIDINKAIQIIFWSMEGFANQQQEKLKALSMDQVNPEETLVEMESYLDMLKEAFYK